MQVSKDKCLYVLLPNYFLGKACIEGEFRSAELYNIGGNTNDNRHSTVRLCRYLSLSYKILIVNSKYSEYIQINPCNMACYVGGLLSRNI